MQPSNFDQPYGYRRSLANRKAIIIVAIVLLIGFAWTRGTFDNFLWRVHLNYNDCAQNGFGAVFCGDALKNYQKEIRQP